MSTHEKKETTTAQDLKIGGYITACLAPGIAAFGFFINESAVMPMVAAATLMIFTGAGCILAAAHLESDD